MCLWRWAHILWFCCGFHNLQLNPGFIRLCECHSHHPGDFLNVSHKNIFCPSGKVEDSKTLLQIPIMWLNRNVWCRCSGTSGRMEPESANSKVRTLSMKAPWSLNKSSNPAIKFCLYALLLSSSFLNSLHLETESVPALV